MMKKNIYVLIVLLYASLSFGDLIPKPDCPPPPSSSDGENHYFVDEQEAKLAAGQWSKALADSDCSGGMDGIGVCPNGTSSGGCWWNGYWTNIYFTPIPGSQVRVFKAIYTLCEIIQDTAYFYCDVDPDCFCDPATDPDSDGDGIPDECDICPGQNDRIDSDDDGTPDCKDECPNNKKLAIADPVCGCDTTDSDDDGTIDCKDLCPNDRLKVEPGDCGCGNPDKHSDGDGVADCKDGCPTDTNKLEPKTCGCGNPETDTDGDGFPDCIDKEDGDGSCDISKQGDPIRIYNGNSIQHENDLAFPSPFSGGLKFKRYYNSRSSENSAVGFGWTHTYNAIMQEHTLDAGELIKIVDETGRGIYFKFNGTIFEGMNKEQAYIETVNDRYIWHRNDDKIYSFDEEGKLLSMEDSHGNRQILGYDDTQRLETVTDEASGRSLTFHYDELQRIVNIQGPVTASVTDGIWVTFGYDAFDNLTSVSYADGSGYEYQYEDSNDIHNMTGKNDIQGHQIARWTFDNQDRAFSSISRDGANVTIDYTDMDAINVTDAYGVTRTFGISEIAGRKKVTTVAGESGCASCSSDVIRYDYDQDRNLTEKEYRNGRIDKFLDYDSRGHARTVITGYGSQDERTVTSDWHPRLETKLRTTEPSLMGTGVKETIWDYDNDGNDTPNEDPTDNMSRKIERGMTVNSAGAVVQYDHVTAYTYNDKDQVTSIDGPLSGDQDKTIFTYDPETGDLLTVTNPVTGTITFTYDDAGNTITTTDINGIETVTTYDGKNRPLTSQRDGKTSSRTYTPQGDIETVTDAEMRTTTYTYEAQFGRLERMADGLGNYHHYAYDGLGHRIEDAVFDATDTRQNIMQFNFQGPDNSGKLWKQINFDGSFTEFAYDDSGNRSSVTSADNKTVSYAYDALNRVISVTQPGQVLTSYTYDPQGNLATVTDPNGNTTLYTYDDLGRLVETLSPDTGVTRYAYNAAGKLESKTVNSGLTTGYTYDALGRLTGINYADPSENVTLTYDQGTNGMGRLTGKTGPGYSDTYTYTIAGQIASVVQTIDSHSFTTTYTYDETGILTGMTYPDGRTVTYGLDANGRYEFAATTKSGITETLVSLGEYKPFGPLTALNFGNGIPLTRTYDQGYNLTDITAGTVQDLTYARDPAGKITGITNNLDSTRDQSFTYDDLNRLDSATGIYGDMAFTYDKVGNRQSIVQNNLLETYTYLPDSNIIESVTGGLPKAFIHNDDGNILTAVTNTLESVPGTESSYLYNSDGQRIRKIAGGLTVYYHYDLAGNLIALSDATGTLVTSYIYMGGTRIATVATDGTICYYHNNHLETPEVMTDQSGAVVWKADYKPFGEALIDPASTVVNDFRFPGQIFDSETGYHYNWNRYYDPGTGRYLTADPIGLAGGINLYGYVGGNPINVIDPMGLMDITWGQVGTGVLGGILTAIPDPLSTTVGLTMLSGLVLIIPGDQARSDQDSDTNEQSRSIPKPCTPKKGCTCTCRADADGNMPGNIQPGMSLFAFGTSTASDCSTATKEAKRQAIHALGAMKVKHVGCRCSQR